MMFNDEGANPHYPRYPRREGLPPVPPRMVGQRNDHRGYPIPWFVAWVEGKPDFRVMCGLKLTHALKWGCCWLCGERLGANKTFVIGPMCAVNRTSAEPPSHLDCAQFAATACPFLTLPKAVRREANRPAANLPAGEMLMRNPGTTCLWTTKSFTLFSPDGVGQLIRIGDPQTVSWYTKGRLALRDEVMESIDSGVPSLYRRAVEQDTAERSQSSRIYFEECYARAMQYVPL